MRRMGLPLLVCGCLSGGVLAADRYWVASSDSNWNDTGNWSASSGGASGASVPGSGDVAIFDGGGAGSCAIDIAITVQGLRITNYTETVTQSAGRTVTVNGEHGFKQYSGTFAGGDANIGIAHNGAGGYFTLAGGVFTNTSGTLTVGSTSVPHEDADQTIFTYSGGEFRPNGGTLKFASSIHATKIRTHTIQLNGRTLTVNHLVYSGGNTWEGFVYALGSAADVFLVKGNFSFEGPGSSGRGTVANNGTIKVEGDVTVQARTLGGTTVVEATGTNDTQYVYTGGRGPHLTIGKTRDDATVTPAAGTTNLAVFGFTLSNGAFTAPSSTMNVGAGTGHRTIFTYSGGEFRPNGGTLKFASSMKASGTTTHTIQLNGQTLTVNHLAYSAGNTWERFVYALGSAADVFLVEGNFTFEGHSDNTWAVRADNGTIKAEGDVTVNPGTYAGGTTKIELIGANTQTVAQYGSNSMPPKGHWTIDKDGGSVVLATDVTLGGTAQDLNWTEGLLNLSSNTLSVGRNVLVHSETPGATLSIGVAGTNTAGRLTVGGQASGMGHIGLAVDVTATKEEVPGQEYTILSNSTTLGGNTFGSVTWHPLWNGTVRYDYAESGHVSLCGIYKKTMGTVLLFR